MLKSIVFVMLCSLFCLISNQGVAMDSENFLRHNPILDSAQCLDSDSITDSTGLCIERALYATPTRYCVALKKTKLNQPPMRAEYYVANQVILTRPPEVSMDDLRTCVRNYNATITKSMMDDSVHVIQLPTHTLHTVPDAIRYFTGHRLKASPNHISFYHQSPKRKF